MPGDPANISFSFVKLQRLEASFEALCEAAPGLRGHERTVRRMVDQLGATALPLLVRRLAGPDQNAAGWASRLLGQLAESDRLRSRVESALASVATSAATEAARGRAAALLGELTGERDGLDDAEALRDHSLRELARRLDTAAEVARAADLIIAQLEDHELLGFVDEFAATEPRRASALVDELLARDDLDERSRSELRRIRAPLPRGAAPSRMAGARAYLGTRADGRSAVIAFVLRPHSRPARYRVCWCVIDESGILADAGYRAELTRGAIERDLLRPARATGFPIARAPLRTSAGRVATAARAAIARGYKLSREFYLGRDIVGIRDEHCADPRESDAELTLLLGRAIDLVAVGEYDRARPLLDRYVARRPDDPEGRANLGLCLLASDDAASALRHLRRAAWLQPADAMHHWNLAAAAHRAGDPSRCYLALCDYLARHDDRDGREQRAEAARASISEYERIARLEYPDATPADVAQADGLIARAGDDRAARRTDAAIAGYARALELVPSHAVAWRELGQIYATRRQLDDARRCLRQAQALRPDDRTTRRLLARLARSSRHPTRH